jgi:hypothetical protein
MKPSAIPRTKMIFVGLFAVGCVVIWAVQVFYVWPRDRCEAHAGWWDPQSRICATPILISRITGRPNGAKAPAAAPKPEPATR